MELSRSVIKQFVDVTNDTVSPKNSNNTVYGEIVEINGGTYAKIDGSNTVTPVATTAKVKVGDRVVITLKNHTATVIGNTTDPSASSAKVSEIEGNVTKFETIVADKASIGELEAQIARIEELEAEYATIDTLIAKDAEIENLLAKTITAEEVAAKYASIETLEANYATVYELDAKYADIDDLSAAKARIDILDAKYAEIDTLYATKAEVGALNSTYANIDFSNIGDAAITRIFSDYGLIKDIAIDNGTITGELVGVTIKGDLIEGNTIKADKLVVLGNDGLYYKLNIEGGTFAEAEEVPTDSLHGSIITAKSITATKISVEDLVAFDATIGGFNITEDSIYSGVKESVDNGTRGIYLDNDGQVSFGDAFNFLKYYRTDDGSYKLEISASSILFGVNNKPIEDAIGEVVNDELKNIEIGGRNLIRNSNTLRFKDYYFSGPLVFTHDGDGNVEAVCGLIEVLVENNDVTVRTSATVTDDGAGNVTIT